MIYICIEDTASLKNTKIENMLQTIKFHYKIKRPKLLENNVFVLYSPYKLKFQPGEKKMVDMKLNIKFPTNVRGSCRLLFQLSNAGLQLQNSNYLSADTNLHFEILNSNMTQTIEINSKGEIGYFTPDCVGAEIQYQYVKTN